MQNPAIRALALTFLVVALSCTQSPPSAPSGHSMEFISRPYARYWWFASEINKEDIRYNLDWLHNNGFGGVEIAWVYPLNRMYPEADSTYTPRQPWLSDEWQKIVAFAISYADSIGLACDMTMGTLWPFGDSQVTYNQASQTWGTEDRQKIRASWEYPVEGYVVDHLNPVHYLNYFGRMLERFPRPKTGIPQSYFIDSWEVQTQKLWTDGFGDEFEARYGYRIEAFLDAIYEEGNRQRLYDYMCLISEKVVAFYGHFTATLNSHNIFSRAQCAGAPADIISAYARVDIPEGEAMLYEPEYNQIPASAATLSGKRVVSAESFTCLYGWPRDYLRQEQTADLKLVADGLFANGINHIVWHGKPHNPKNQDTVSFYASVHLGPDGALAREIPAFNQYLEKVSAVMKRGVPYTDVAVYLPTEDAWINGMLPKEKQMRWLWGHYEMRNIYFPDELEGFHPTWINREFLEQASWENERLMAGSASFSSLYVDAVYLDLATLKSIAMLASQGLPVTLKKLPEQAGTKNYPEWNIWRNELIRLPNVNPGFSAVSLPLIEGEVIPPYRSRKDGNTLYIFFANPKAKRLSFPLDYGQSYSENTESFQVVINHENIAIPLTLQFEPYQSLLYEIKDSVATKMDISFIPKTPVVKERPADFVPPWL